MTMIPLNAALVISNKSLLDQAHSCIQNLPVRIALEQSQESSGEELMERLERHRVDVVLMEAGRMPMALEDVVRRLKNTATQPAVFILHTEASPQLILECLRAGASEYLFPPLQEPLREAFEKLAIHRAKSGPGLSGGLGKIFGFISAKGGCGSTTIACHVATSLAKTLERPVLLADMDFEAGLIRFIMKCKNTYSVRDAVVNMHRMDSSYWKALISTKGKLDIIPAPDEVAVKIPPSGDEVIHLARFIRSYYPAAVLDFGRCHNAPASSAIHELETLFVVSTPDAVALDCSRQCIDSLGDGSAAAARVEVLLNKVPERGAMPAHAIERKLGRAVAASFTSDFATLYDAYSEGHLLDSGSALGKQLGRFSGNLADRIRGMEPKREKLAKAETGAGARKWLSFFQRGSEQPKPVSAKTDTSGPAVYAGEPGHAANV